MLFRNAILVILGALGSTLSPMTVYAQTPPGTPLPQVMYSAWPKAKISAFIWHPIAVEADSDKVWARVWFDTSNKLIEASWFASASEDAYPYVEDEVYPVSYQPTAICRKAGRSPTIYVSGYIQRTGHVIVEEWTAESLIVGVAQPQGSEQEKTTLSKIIRKEVVFLSNEIGPIRSMVYNKHEERLWLLEENVPHTVWRVNLSSGVAQPYFDDQTLPALALAESSQTMLVEPSAPDGGGFLILLYPWRCWKPAWLKTPPPADSIQMYMLRDVNLDGVPDESTYISWNQLKDIRLYLDHEDPVYP